MLPNQIQPANLTLQAYNQYRTTYPAVEIIGAVLWDTAAYVSAATLRLQFFSTPRATPDLTNMDTPGMLTNNKAMLIRAIRFKPLQHPRTIARAAAGNVQTGATDNIAQFLNSGFFRLMISAKPYAEFPLWVLPAGDGAVGSLGVDGDTADPGLITDYANNGLPSPDNVFSLSQPLFISPMVNFYAEIVWPAALTLAAAANVNLRVLFDGDMMRPVQ